MLQVNIGDAFKLGEGANTGINASANYRDLGTIITSVLPNVMVVANLILFFLILFGGFKLVTAAGNPDQQKQGADILRSALIGFALVFGAYWIIQLLAHLTGVNVLTNTV